MKGGEDGSAFVRGECPGIALAGDTSPDSALAADRFPVADRNGELSYTRTSTPTDDRVHERLGDVEVVIHDVDLDGSGAYDGEARSSLTDALPLEATIPVLLRWRGWLTRSCSTVGRVRRARPVPCTPPTSASWGPVGAPGDRGAPRPRYRPPLADRPASEPA